MSKDLKAENLTISLPNKGCNKNCPYCVAKMTGPAEENLELIFRNIEKVVTVSKSAEVTSVMFTGKGEPLLRSSLDIMLKLSEHFKEWPLEVQTNGVRLIENPFIINSLYDSGFNVIAVSVDSDKQLELMKDTFKSIDKKGLVSRMTLNITKLLSIYNFQEILEYCYQNKIRQLTLRKIVAPENPKDEQAAEWIKKNVIDFQFESLVESAMSYIEQYGRLIRTTNDGLQIWDCNGVSFAHSDYCIQEKTKGSDIRSLIFHEDGHLYTSWNSKASIIF